VGITLRQLEHIADAAFGQLDAINGVGPAADKHDLYRGFFGASGVPARLG
jgi:hypothetical protein